MKCWKSSLIESIIRMEVISGLGKVFFNKIVFNLGLNPAKLAIESTAEMVRDFGNDVGPW